MKLLVLSSFELLVHHCTTTCYVTDDEWYCIWGRKEGNQCAILIYTRITYSTHVIGYSVSRSAVQTN